MNGAKRIVMLAAVVLFAVWLAVHWGRVTGDADASIRFTLGVLFAVLVILRGKPQGDAGVRIPDGVFPLALGVGVLAALGGIIFRVHMSEWVGVLLLLFACGFWVAPRRFRTDLALAFAVLFWVHPLPGQVFGWMQGMMQRLSVIGSEMILHVFNVRIWGDGIVLRAGYQNFLVPEACSGMRTSVTVFLCALGVGLLLRLRGWETLGFIVLGLLQVLVLNITRISYLVLWAPRMPPEWAENFLHDSLGSFLLAAIVLVQLEAVWWRWWTRRRAFIREGIRKKELERPDKASIIPHSLRQLVMVMVVMGGVGLLGFGLFVIVYKNRAYHRKEMIREVAEGLMETDPDSAARAFVQIRQRFPADRELIALHANTEFIRGRFDEGLVLLDRMDKHGGTLELRHLIMKAWALTRTDRAAESRVLINALPPEHDRIPGVAMLKAEFAAVDRRPAVVAHHVRVAAGSHLMLPRLRALFPYLAHHEQWQAIVASDHDRPYAELHQALIALHANQRVNNLSGLIRVMRQTLQRWPDDPRLMGPLFEIAVQRREGEWEAYFARNLRANVDRMAPDALSTAADYSWRFRRPDLAWLVYAHLDRIAPGDPELIMAPARYGGGWSMLRRHQIGVQADTADRLLDLAPVLALFSQTRPVQDFRRRIPFLDDALKARSSHQAARGYLERALAALEAREAEAPLALRHMRLYPAILAALNRFDDAHQRLDLLRELFPAAEEDVLFRQASLLDQQGRWQESYERLNQYRQLQPVPNLAADLLKINALMNLNLGVCAMQVLEEARVAFPGALRLDLAEAAIWDVFGYKAQALHVFLQSEAGQSPTPAVVGLLYATGRPHEAQRLSAAYGFAAPAGVVRQDPPMWLPPAALLLKPRWPPPPAQQEINTTLARLRAEAQTGGSPYISALQQRRIEWTEALREGLYAVPGEAERAGRVAYWEAAGRSALERLGAVYELAMLAVRQGDMALAEAAVQRGIELAPGNPVLWRVRIALSDGDEAVVQEAQRRCPDDPDIFLAGLVMAVRAAADPESRLAVAQAAVERGLEGQVFSAETLVQAGDFLLSENMPAQAAPLARAAVARSRGLLAAHVLALRTALALGDMDWAQTAVINGIERARDPVPFYRAMVEIKAARRQVDSDLLSALEYLRTNQQEDTRWAETLGALYFQRGDMQRALTVFGPVLRDHIQDVQTGSVLLAAEAARLNARHEHAARLLEAAYATRPDQVGVLNNLVYLLAQAPDTLPRARQLLPSLLALGEDRFEVMDTAAMVALRSGDTVMAKQWMDKALSRLEDGAYAVHEVRLNAAELKLRMGDVQTARTLLEQLRRDPARPDFVDQRARLLLREADAMEGGRR